MEPDQDNQLDTQLDKQSTAGESADKPAPHNAVHSQSSTHSLGSSLSAVATGAVGAVVGAAGGSVGAVVGAVVGGVVGGFVGKSAAEAIDPATEDTYWREHYAARPYRKPGRLYEGYQLAYRTGYEGYIHHQKSGKPYEAVEPQLRHAYESHMNEASLEWNDVKYAVRDAWDRADRNVLSYNEDAYWRTHYTAQPYCNSILPYDHYQAAFRAGYEGYLRYHSTGRSYDEVEPELQRDYERNVTDASLAWNDANPAARAAWNRMERIFSDRSK